MDTRDYKAASERTDADERALIPPFKPARANHHQIWCNARVNRMSGCDCGEQNRFHATQRAVIYSTKHKGSQIEIIKGGDGFGALIDGKILNQFDNVTEPYWFSTSFSATQSAKQQIDKLIP